MIGKECNRKLFNRTFAHYPFISYCQLTQCPQDEQLDEEQDEHPEPPEAPAPS